MEPAHAHEAAGLRTGLDRVLHQVRDHLVELLRDAFHRAVAVQIQIDLYGAPGRRHHQRDHFADGREHVVRPQLPRVPGLAVAGHQLDGGGDAADSALGEIEQLVHALLGARQLLRWELSGDERFGVHADPGERVFHVVEGVVDLVREAAGHDFQRVHALREHDVRGGLLRLHQRPGSGEELARREGLRQIRGHAGLQADHAVL
ncbi:MAG: hypothetical protein E6J63_19885 [Deltaproteobacteria bacterium]|nr:MAG: hypothetical protein E6J63_19885 [Deltaproteobacteria bacterium]